MSEQYRCNSCGYVFDMSEMMCSVCGNGLLKLLRWRKGGDGSHWEGCEEVHWDCRIAQLEAENRRIRVELHTLRFKEYQEQRFIWWIWNVYSRNVNDLILSIMGATTYDTEGEAKEGKYALPKHCFDLMKRIDEYTEHIYDGTYLDIEVSTENKTVPENKPEYTEPSNNDGSATQNVCSWIQEDDPEINLWRTSCHNTFYLEADTPSDNHMKYCCYCGKEIAELTNGKN